MLLPSSIPSCNQSLPEGLILIHVSPIFDTIMQSVFTRRTKKMFITETSPYKSNPRFAPNIWGKPGVGIENEKYSLYLNFIDKTCKIYLFVFLSICFIQYCSI